MTSRRLFLSGALLFSTCLHANSRAPVRQPRPRAITQCSWGGNTFSLLDAPAVSPIARFSDLEITGQFLSATGDKGAKITFLREGHPPSQKLLPELYNPNGWIGYSEDLRSIAINSSNGGAAGGWFIHVFRVDERGAIQDLTSAVEVVAKDFSSRHDCPTRGDNYEAEQWRSNTQLLISASVYGTSDCGKEMGYTEGYVLDVVTGQIVKHLSERAMLDLPYVCTYNVWQAGDPQIGRPTSPKLITKSAEH